MQISDSIIIVFKLLGMHIKRLREERNISLQELSEKTNIRKEYLNRIENGNAYSIKLNTHLVKIAKVMNVKLSDLIDYK